MGLIKKAKLKLKTLLLKCIIYFRLKIKEYYQLILNLCFLKHKLKECSRKYLFYKLILKILGLLELIIYHSNKPTYREMYNHKAK